MEENRLEIVDLNTIQELMTFIIKGNSYEADKGFHDDMITTLILFSWYVTTEYFTHLTDTKVKQLLYAEQQKLIEDDILPAGFMRQTVPKHNLLWMIREIDGILTRRLG